MDPDVSTRCALVALPRNQFHQIRRSLEEFTKRLKPAFCFRRCRVYRILHFLQNCNREMIPWCNVKYQWMFIRDDVGQVCAICEAHTPHWLVQLDWIMLRQVDRLLNKKGNIL